MFIRKPIYLMSDDAATSGDGAGTDGTASAGSTGAAETSTTGKGDDADEGKTFTQADVERIIAGRLAKYADYDTVKSQLADLQTANQSEQERAVNEARREGEKAGRDAVAPLLVGAEFRAALAGRRNAEQVAALIEDLDLSKYLTENGEVDVERVAKKAELLAPQEEPRTPVTFGGGVRKTPDAPDSAPGLGRIRDAYASSSK